MTHPVAVGLVLAAAVLPPDAVERVGGVVRAVAAGRLVVTVAGDDGPADRTVAVPAGTKLLFGGKTVALADLRPGMTVELAYRGNSTDLLAVTAGWPPREVVVKAADPATNSFSIETGGDEGGFEIVYKLVPGAVVKVDGLLAGLADVPAGAKVRLDLALDRSRVRAVEADELPDALPGLVKRYDAATRTLLVEVRAAGFRADRVVTIGFPLAPTTNIRRGGRDVPAAELRERMPVRLTFAADRCTVTRVLAADPLPPEVNDDD